MCWYIFGYRQIPFTTDWDRNCQLHIQKLQAQRTSSIAYIHDKTCILGVRLSLMKQARNW